MRIYFALVLSSSALVYADHEINTAPVRGFVQKQLVDPASHTLRVGPTLSGAQAGITAAAVSKANQTLRGMTGFNRGIAAGNYVQTMGKEKLILTASAPGQKVDGVGSVSADNEQEFVLRTGKTGTVIARGNLDQVSGKLTFTTSHNYGEESAAK